MRIPIAAVSILASLAALEPAVAQGNNGEEFQAGTPLDTTTNVRIYGSFRFAESCSFDETRDVIVTPNLGVSQNSIENDGYVSMVNPDGTVHNPKWIGVNRNGLTLNDPRGSDIQNGMLYVADIDTIRWFDIATGEPKGTATIDGAAVLNDLEVATDGTVYATQHGNNDGSVPWRIYKVTADGNATILVEGGALNRPNGIAFDPDGNVVVVQIGDDKIHTFSPDGELLTTETSLDSGNDGLVIVADGTKYVSSVRHGTVARIPSGGTAEMIASGIPSAASMCHDPVRNQLVIPMNNWNAIAIVGLN